MPTFAFRDVFDDINKNAGGFAGFGGEDLGRIFIDADCHNPIIGVR
jgi:hypothetical protein